jgi:hypothetical protein
MSKFWNPDYAALESEEALKLSRHGVRRKSANVVRVKTSVTFC